MRLTQVILYRVSLPMLTTFEHAGASRDRTDNVVCELTFDDGTRGYGEAVARKYVTGETPDISWQLLSVTVAQLKRDIEVTTGLAALQLARQWAEAVPDRRGVISNASRCALELALIDALFTRLGQSPVPALALHAGRPSAPPKPNLTYSMVAGKSLLADEQRLGELKARYGYTQIKAKVGFGLEQDLQNMKRLRNVFGDEADIRVDANRAWTYDEAAAFLDKAAAMRIRTVEDPLAGTHLEQMCHDMRRLRDQTGCVVILDEPIRTLNEAMVAVEHGAANLMSVRVSKCGGLMRSLDIAILCETHGVGIQLGCQVGETAILSAAGRRLAESIGTMSYLEGSNERLKFAPEQDLCSEQVMYGSDARGAVLEAPGLGITVLRDRLTALASDIVVTTF